MNIQKQNELNVLGNLMFKNMLNTLAPFTEEEKEYILDGVSDLIEDHLKDMELEQSYNASNN